MKHFRILMLAMVSLCCRKEDISHDVSVQFNKFYGGSGDEGAISIVRGSDGGYVFAGQTSSNDGDVTGNHGGRDAWIVKLKNDGAIQWQKAFGGSRDDIAYSMISSGDGGYIFVGKSESNDGDVSGNVGQTGAWIVKLGKDGNMLWQKIIAPSEEGVSIAATSDGYVVFIQDYPPWGDHPTKVVKIDKNGQILWQLALGKEIFTVAHNIISSSDGQVIVVGDILLYATDVGSIAKIDKDGNLLWHRSLDGGGLPITTIAARSVVNSSDGGYVLAGVAAGNGIDGWIVKVDKDGFTQWQKTYGTTDEEQIERIIKSSDGGYIVAGLTLGEDNSGSGKYNGWLFKIDESGNMLWQNRYSKRSGEIFYSLIENPAGEFVIAGGSKSNSCAHTEDAWILTVTK